jgi:CHASE3 domain sensor protein
VGQLGPAPALGSGVDLFSRFRLLIVAAISIPLAILFAVLWSLTDSHQSIEKTMSAVKDVRSLDEDLERVQAIVVEAESAQRGFLLTGLTNYLKPYERATEQLPPALAKLETSVAANGQTQAQIKMLRQLVEERMDLVAESVRLARANDHTAAMAVVLAGRGHETMEGIRLLTQSIRLQKQGDLTAGRLELNRRLRMDSIAAAILACFDIFFLGGMVLLVLRLLNLQQIATVCAWSKTIRYQDDWISFEEYLRRKFGIVTTHGISHEMAAQLLANREETRRDEDVVSSNRTFQSVRD